MKSMYFQKSEGNYTYAKLNRVSYSDLLNDVIVIVYYSLVRGICGNFRY